MTLKTLQFGGTELFEVSVERLFAAAIDLDALPQNIPDLVSHERIDEHTLRAVVRPGVSFLRGTMKLEVQMVDLDPPHSGTMKMLMQGIGATIRVASQMRISPRDGGSQLDWQAEVTELKGLIATVSPTLVRAMAEQTITHSWNQLRARLKI